MSEISDIKDELTIIRITKERDGALQEVTRLFSLIKGLECTRLCLQWNERHPDEPPEKCQICTVKEKAREWDGV